MKITPEWLEKKIETEPEIPFNVVNMSDYKKKKAFDVIAFAKKKLLERDHIKSTPNYTVP